LENPNIPIPALQYSPFEDEDENEDEDDTRPPAGLALRDKPDRCTCFLRTSESKVTHNLQPNMNRFFRTFSGLGVVVLTALSAVQSHGQPAAGPMPVPPEVAIARPSDAEVEQARQSLKKFLDSADPATKALVKKYPELISVQPPPRVNTAVVPSLAAGFRTKHARNVESITNGEINVLFMGDSITDFWRNSTGPMAGKPVFDKYYGDMKVANFGISGDTTQGVLYRLRDGEGQGFKPRAIMLMIGTNNNGRNSPPEIAEGIGAVVLEMRKDFPDAKILLLGVFPRGGPNDPLRGAIAEVNKRISKLHDGKHVFYLDIGSKFLDENGNIPRDVMGDGLHPTTKGYEIWAEAVKEPLANLLKDGAATAN
jgi:beta-glucosidase